jgi:hypothetical protein
MTIKLNADEIDALSTDPRTLRMLAAWYLGSAHKNPDPLIERNYHERARKLTLEAEESEGADFTLLECEHRHIVGSLLILKILEEWHQMNAAEADAREALETGGFHHRRAARITERVKELLAEKVK